MWLPSLFAAGSCYHPIIDRGGGRGAQNIRGVPSRSAVVGMTLPWLFDCLIRLCHFVFLFQPFHAHFQYLISNNSKDLESNAKTRPCGRQFNCDVRRCVRPLDNDWFRICPRLFSHGWEILNRVCNIGSGRGSVLPLLRHRHHHRSSWGEEEQCTSRMQSRAANNPSVVTITEKAPARAFSFLKPKPSLCGLDTAPTQSTKAKEYIIHHDTWYYVGIV